jgi:hypothetical protein
MADARGATVDSKSQTPVALDEWKTMFDELQNSVERPWDGYRDRN